MFARPTRLAIATTITALTVTACAGGAGARVETGPAPDAEADDATTPAGTSATPPATQTDPEADRLEAIFRARADSARMRYTEADVRFMTGMIGHHAQALIMAELAPTHDANPEIRTLAARIINAQRDEIALMEQWLRDRDQSVPEVRIEGTTLTVRGAEHTAHMPGMLTPEQLRELDAARGPAFDRLFLRYMIQHHRGAVTMVHQLLATDGAGQDEAAFKIASEIQVDQLTEIARMERMLDELSEGGDRNAPDPNHGEAARTLTRTVAK